VAEPRKLKTTEVKKTRLLLLEQQGGLCAICKLPCTEEQACLDHKHGKSTDKPDESGYVRGVLHRGCNAAEGKVHNTLRRGGIKDPEAFLLGLIEYHRVHATNRTGLIHPAHFTPEEKVIRQKAKAKRKRAKAKAEKLA
jgi:hypothetical protein